jgi:2-dehydropantoate 2-reductase
MPAPEIAVLGAGAMGSLVGARLALTRHAVALIDPYEAHIRTIRRHGLRLRDGDESRRVSVAATTDPAAAGAARTVVVLTKANRLGAALDGAAGLLADAELVVVLCNGLGCADVAAARVPRERLAYGAMAPGAVLESPGTVRATFAGDTYIGAAGSVPAERLDDLAALLTHAGLPTHVVDDVEDRIWTKLLVNVGLNAATALTGVRNGELAGDADGAALVAAAIEEAVAVARAKGVTLHVEDPTGFVLELGRTGIARQQSSMLQDILRGRPTEVDFINGAVVREGAALGIPTPVNQALTWMTKVRERHAEAGGGPPPEGSALEAIALSLGTSPRPGSIWVGGPAVEPPPDGRRARRSVRDWGTPLQRAFGAVRPRWGRSLPPARSA